MKYKESVLKHITRRELLEQLAEESTELAQAALKLIRAEGLNNNPTPVDPVDAIHRLDEEYGDVLLCYILLRSPENERLTEAWFPKLKRWAERLEREGKR